MGEEFEGPRDVAEIIISKHRNGALGTVELKFIKNYTKFVELDNPFMPNFDDNSPDPLSSGKIVTKTSKLNKNISKDDDEIPF